MQENDELEPETRPTRLKKLRAIYEDGEEVDETAALSSKNKVRRVGGEYCCLLIRSLMRFGTWIKLLIEKGRENQIADEKSKSCHFYFSSFNQRCSPLITQPFFIFLSVTRFPPKNSTLTQSRTGSRRCLKWQVAP